MYKTYTNLVILLFISELIVLLVKINLLSSPCQYSYVSLTLNILPLIM